MDNKTKMCDTIKAMFDGIDGLIDTKKVIGEPYTVGDTTIIPFIETSMGLGAGDLKSDKEVSGLGCKVKPIACLIIQDGFTKLINIDNQDAITKALDMIPDLVDKLINKNKENDRIKAAINDISAKYED